MSRAQSTRAVALASIGSGSVSVGIARCEGTSVSIVAVDHRALPLEERGPQRGAALIKQEVAEAGKRVLAQFSTTSKTGKIDALYCIIRAPWTHTETVHAEMSYPTEEHMTANIISGLAQKALSSVSDRSQFFDASVTQIALNGYRTKNPEGKRAHHAEVSVLISMCEPAMRSAAQEALAAVFPAHKPVMRSGTRASLEALELIRPDLLDCLVLDIGEEGTAAVVVRQGAADKELFIPEGIRSILGGVSTAGSPEEGRQALRMMARDECSQATCVSMQSALAKMEPDLAHAFGESFAKISTPRRLPAALVLITHPDLAPWLSRFFARIDFTQFTLTAQPFEVTILAPSDLVKLLPGSALNDPDVDLVLGFALINKESCAG